MRYLRLLAVFLALILVGTAQASSLIPINTELVKRSVVFLYAADAAGEPDETKELGTAFVIEIPLVSDPGKSYFALVTARHIVDPVWACLGIVNPVVMYARVNKKDFDPSRDQSGIKFIKVTLTENGTVRWAKHSSDNVDAVVIPIVPADFMVHDVASIPVAVFGTPEEVKAVGIGDDVVSAGLVPGLSGQKRNYPFFKFGKVSNIPEELTVLRCPDGAPRPVEYWYIAATMVAGNSGAPIFYLPPGNAVLRFGEGRPFLLGLQSISVVGGEIAGMTPAQRIFEIVDALKLPDANLFRGLPKTGPQTPNQSPK